MLRENHDAVIGGLQHIQGREVSNLPWQTRKAVARQVAENSGSRGFCQSPAQDDPSMMAILFLQISQVY